MCCFDAVEGVKEGAAARLGMGAFVMGIMANEFGGATPWPKASLTVPLRA